MNKLPCVDCICLAVCKHKCLRYMFYDCKLMIIYWREHVNLQPRDKGALVALSTTQDLNHCMNRVFVPSYLDDTMEKGFGIIDVDVFPGGRTNIKKVIRTCETYYEKHGIDLLKLRTIGKHLNIILETHKSRA